jgi:transcription factor SPN1
MSSSPPAQPVDEAPTPGSDNNDNVFGGASDAGSDNGAPANTADDPAPAAEEGGGDAPEGSGGEGADAYVPATATSAARIPSFKKRRGSGDEDGEGDGDDSDDDDDEERQRRKKKRKERRERRAQEEEEEELPVLDEATQRRHALEERIDNIGKKQRVMRRKKKGGEDVDVSVARARRHDPGKHPLTRTDCRLVP